jgi:hypothetical protein
VRKQPQDVLLTRHGGRSVSRDSRARHRLELLETLIDRDSWALGPKKKKIQGQTKKRRLVFGIRFRGRGIDLGAVAAKRLFGVGGGAAGPGVFVRPVVFGRLDRKKPRGHFKKKTMRKTENCQLPA